MSGDFLASCPLIAGDEVNVEVQAGTSKVRVTSRASGGEWCAKAHRPGYYTGPCSVREEGTQKESVRTLFYRGDRIVESVIPGSCEPAYLEPGIYRIISVHSIHVSGQPSRVMRQEAGLRLEGQSMVGDVSGLLSAAEHRSGDESETASQSIEAPGVPVTTQRSPADGVIVAEPVQPAGTTPVPVNRGGARIDEENPLADVAPETITMTPVEPTAEAVGQSAPGATEAAGKRYRVTVNGIEAFWATNHESGDGKGDEVFIRTRVFWVKKDGTVTMDRVTESLVMGSVKNHPGRVKAGTASDHGGFKDHDRFPADMSATGEVLSGPDGRRVPPMVVWENTFDDEEEAVLVLFSVWEWDDKDKRTARDKWDSWVNNYLVSYIRRFPEKFINAPVPRFGYERLSNVRLLSASKYQEPNLGNYGFNPIDFVKDDTDQTHPLGMSCDGKASELHLYPNILTLNKQTGLSTGESQIYQTKESNFCLTGTAGLGWSLKGEYNIFVDVERLN